MDPEKKKFKIKKPSKEVREAQWKIDSAVVRGKSQPVIDGLKKEFNSLSGWSKIIVK